MALKWSGLVQESDGEVTQNLADPGTDGSSGSLIENRYPLGRDHVAAVMAIRTHLNSLNGEAVVNLLRDGVVEASAPVPPAATTTSTLLAIPFAAEQDVEVQVVIQGTSAEPGAVSLTVVVEFD